MPYALEQYTQPAYALSEFIIDVAPVKDGVVNYMLMLQCGRFYLLKLRPAQLCDCEIAWQWANDPFVRELSFSSDSISWEDHVRWFAANIINPNVRYFVAENEDLGRVGQIRYDITGDEATVSVLLGPESRGKGLAPQLISLGSTEIFSEKPIRLIHAFIKTNNEASVKAFRHAGFHDAGITETHHCPSVHMRLTVHQWRSISRSEAAR